jgi:glycerol-3-phosphate dehydrogenase
MHFFASARTNGADIRDYSEVTRIVANGGCVTSVSVFDHRTHQTYSLGADLIINATGPWSARTAAMLGIDIPVRPVPGVMVCVAPRLTHMVINRLHPADDGDIVVPQRQMSVLGTTAWLAEDPDDIELPADHIQKVVKLCAGLVPRVAALPVRAAWMASRPVIVEDHRADPTKISRTFDALDHAKVNGIEGFISIFGGKATTMRAMAEAAVDLVCAKTGREIACRTRHTRLLNYRTYFRNGNPKKRAHHAGPNNEV